MTSRDPRFVAASLAFLAVVTSGCYADRSVPDGAVFVCDVDDDCPADNACVASLHRCVPKGQLDAVPPALDGIAAVEPRIAKAGDVVTATFEVNEPLQGLPAVNAQTDEGPQAFAVVADDADPKAFTASWTVALHSDQGAVVVADLVDVVGNRASVTIGAVTVDVTPPHISGVAFNHSGPTRSDVDMFLTISVDEELAADETVLTWDPTTPSVVPFASTSVSQTFRVFPVDGDEETLTRVDVQDLAGNTASASPNVPFIVDDTPPESVAVTLTVDGAPADRVKDGATLVAEVNLSADVTSYDVRLDDGEVFQCGDILDVPLVCTLVVDGPDAVETPSFVVARGFDRAGNVTSASRAVVLDNRLAALTVDGPRLARAGGTSFTPIAACLDTRVDVGFVSDEPLASATVTAECEPSTIFVPVGVASPTSFAFSAPLLRGVQVNPPPLTVDECPLVAHVVDGAGNAGDVPLAVLPIDCQAPDEGAIDASLFEHLRSPWGSRILGASATHALAAIGEDGAGAPGPGGVTQLGAIDGAAFPSDTFEARVYAGPDVGAPRIGVVAKRLAGGNWAATFLSGGDARAIFVSAVDGAGNESLRVPVTHGAWIASFGRKVAGSSFENPHDLFAAPVFTGALDGPARRGLGAVDGVDAAGGGAAETQGATSLARVAGSFDPDLVFGDDFDNNFPGQAALDPHSGNVIKPFGFRRFTFNGLEWSALPDVDAEGDGSPITAVATFFDPFFDAVSLVDANGDVWILDSSTSSFRHVDHVDLAADCGDGASAAFFCARGAFDEARAVFVLTLGDGNVYEHDAVAGGWRYVAVDPAAPLPVDREGAAVGYDPIGGRLLEFGGRALAGGGGPGGFLGDTWAWDGDGWTELVDAVGPHQRTQATAVTDFFAGPAGELLILDGEGCFPSGEVCGFRDLAVVADTWRFDGTTWQPAGTSFGAFFGSGVSRNGETLLVWECGTVGGTFCNNTSSNVARRAAGAWEPVTPNDATRDGNPPSRFFTSLGVDEASGDVVLFGGVTQVQGASLLGDTWTLHGNDWIFRSDDPSVARYGASMAYDAVDGHLVMFGGVDFATFLRITADTLFFDAASGTWGLGAVASAPPARQLASMTTGTDGRPWLFGGGPGVQRSPPGTAFNDLWRFDGAGWVPVAATNAPPARVAGALALDPQTGFLVLLGGCDGSERCDVSFDDAWVFDGIDGHAWTQITADPEDDGSPAQPTSFTSSGTTSFSLVVDRARGPAGAVVALGGGTGPYELVNDGAAAPVFSWRRVAQVDAEGDGTPRNFLATASTSTTLWDRGGTGETFRYVGAAATRPAHVATFRFAASGVLGDALLTGARVDWIAGGKGGADVFLADHGRLTALGSTTAAAAAPSLVSASFTPPVLDLAEGALRLVALPHDANGADGASIATDDVELTLDYALP